MHISNELTFFYVKQKSKEFPSTDEKLVLGFLQLKIYPTYVKYLKPSFPILYKYV